MSWTSGLQLKVVEGQERGRTIRLDHPEVTLGRAQTKGERAPGWIFFNEPTVSRVHAILSWDDSRKHYILNHRSKTNASLVNGSPVDHHPITIGTRLQLGLLVLEMQSAEAASSARSPVCAASTGSFPVAAALEGCAGCAFTPPVGRS